MRELIFKRVSLLSVFAVPSLFFGEAIEYLSNGLINSELFIDKVVNLEQLQEQIRPLKSGSKNLKVVVALDGAGKL